MSEIVFLPDPHHQPDMAASRAFADSKKLTEAKREELFEALLLQNKIAWATDSLTATFISEQMLQACVQL